jgi:hypothetical protein
MNIERFFLHPVLLNRRSRWLLFWYVLAATITSLVLWWRLEQLAYEAGIPLSDAAAGAPPLAQFLLAPYMRAIAIVFSACIATVLTSMVIVGPVRRIEEWLAAWEAGLDVRPIKVRDGDPYETMMRLLNEIHLKAVKASLLGRRLRGPLAKKPGLADD